ncbi:class I SAM-dependent methyltransferase, partial [Solirubrobacter deserti]
DEAAAGGEAAAADGEAAAAGGEAAAFKSFEAAGWSARAGTYDALTARATAFAHPALLAHVKAGDRVVDVGCGPGTLAAAAAAKGADVTGVDLAPGMIAEARRRHPDLSFVEADAERLPFEDGAFDVALGAFLVNHTPDARAAVAELKRVARTVALAAWGPAEEVAFLDLPSRAVSGLGGVPDGPDSELYAHPDRLAALLGGDATVTTVRDTLHVDSLDALWDGARGGTVRTAARIEHATDEHRARLEALAEPYRTAAGYALPLTILVAWVVQEP